MLKITTRSKEAISKEIEEYVANTDASYMEAALTIIEEKDLEMESIPKLLSDRILFKIEKEASALNMIKVEPSNSYIEMK